MLEVAVMYNFLHFSETYRNKVPPGSLMYQCNWVILSHLDRDGNFQSVRNARELAEKMGLRYSTLYRRLQCVQNAIQYLNLGSEEDGRLEIRSGYLGGGQRFSYVNCLIKDGIRNWRDIDVLASQAGVADEELAPLRPEQVFHEFQKLMMTSPLLNEMPLTSEEKRDFRRVKMSLGILRGRFRTLIEKNHRLEEELSVISKENALLRKELSRQKK